MLEVTLTNKNGERQVLQFNKSEVVIGRVQSNDIVLPQRNVSKKHSKISLQPDGQVVVIDLKSTNGTYVNGQKINGVFKLSSSDKLFIGDFVIQAKNKNGQAAQLQQKVEYDESLEIFDSEEEVDPNESMVIDNPAQDAPTLPLPKRKSKFSTGLVKESLHNDELLETQMDWKLDPGKSSQSEVEEIDEVDEVSDDDSSQDNVEEFEILDDEDIEEKNKNSDEEASVIGGKSVPLLDEEESIFQNLEQEARLHISEQNLKQPQKAREPDQDFDFVEPKSKRIVEPIVPEMPRIPKKEPLSSPKPLESKEISHSNFSPSPEPLFTPKNIVHSKEAWINHVYLDLKSKAHLISQIDDPEELSSIIETIAESALEKGILRQTFDIADITSTLFKELKNEWPIEQYLADHDVSECIVEGIDSFTFKTSKGLLHITSVFSSEASLKDYLLLKCHGISRKNLEDPQKFRTLFFYSDPWNITILKAPVTAHEYTVIFKKVTVAQSLNHLVDQQTLDAKTRKILEKALDLKKGILVSSSHPSVMYRFIEAMARKFDPNELIAIAAQGAGIRLDKHHSLYFFEENEFDAPLMFQGIVSVFPERIIISNVSSSNISECLMVNQSVSSGIIAGIRSLSSLDAFEQIERTVQEQHKYWTSKFIHRRIYETFSLLVHIENLPKFGMRVLEVKEIAWSETNKAKINALVEFRPNHEDPDGGDFQHSKEGASFFK